jgi:PAS domain S-box-containing protein
MGKTMAGGPERRSGADRRGLAFHLTPREVEVLAFVLRGLENKEIAGRLGLAEQSIKDHVSALLQKFAVHNRAALAEAGGRLALTGGIDFDPDWVPQLFREAEPQICVASGPDMRYEAVNDAFVRAVGGRPLLGRTMREAFPELEGQGVFEMVERVYATGEAAVIHERSSKWDRGDGPEPRLVDLVVQPLRDEAGTVNGIISFAVDVTEVVRKGRRNELVSEELGAVLDLVPSGVIVVDDQGMIVRANAAAQRIAGIPLDPSEPLDVQARDAFEGRDAGGHRLSLDEMPVGRALRGETTLEEEFTFRTRNGAIRVRTSVRPLRGLDGDIRGAIAVFTKVD